MAFLSHKKKEIRAKIVYYGPGLSGKTSNVEYIFRKMRADHRGDLINLSTKDRTLFFDFLPVELGNIKGYKTSFHMFTVPGQVFYNETRKAVLNDVDGIVFVADSQKKMRDDNERSLKNLEENLSEYGYKLSDIPHVFQYNKRDMADIMSVEELHLSLNKTGAPFFEAVATEGVGILNTLKLISKMVLKDLASKAGSIQEREEAFEEGNYGLSQDYVALNPGELAPASVKAVTAMEFGVVLEESNEDGDVEPEEAAEPVEEAEQIEEVPEPVAEVAEPYEAEIGTEPVDESEIPTPPSGTEWTPPEQEEIVIEEPEVSDVTEPVEDEQEEVVRNAEDAVEFEPMEAEETPAEVVEAAPEVVEKAPAAEAESSWEVQQPTPEPTQPPAAPQPPPPNPPPSDKAKEIKLYQWGFPERIDVNTIRIPVFFKDEETKDEFWSYLTIGLEHIYKR